MKPKFRKNLKPIVRKNTRSLLKPETVRSKFDKDMAIDVINLPENKLSLNPLFLNPRQFNVTTVDYKT